MSCNVTVLVHSRCSHQAQSSHTQTVHNMSSINSQTDKVSDRLVNTMENIVLKTNWIWGQNLKLNLKACVEELKLNWLLELWWYKTWVGMRVNILSVAMLFPGCSTHWTDVKMCPFFCFVGQRCTKTPTQGPCALLLLGQEVGEWILLGDNVNSPSEAPTPSHFTASPQSTSSEGQRRTHGAKGTTVNILPQPQHYNW